MGLYHSLLSILLSFSIVFTGTPFQLFFKAQAQESSSETSENNEARKKEEKIEDLRRSFTNPRSNQAELDTFQLSKQVVVDDRPQNIEAIIQDKKVQDYQERMEYLEGQIKTFEELSQKVNGKIKALKAGETKKFQELHVVLDDIQSRKKLAELEIKDLKNFDPRKGEGLPVDFMVDKEMHRRHYWGNKMQILVEKDGEVVEKIQQREFTESLSPKFNKANPLQGLSGDTTFAIADKKGNVLHRFLKPVEAIFFYGHYLVYIEKNSFNANSKTMPLRFIDLNYFKANIGNARLPVFTLPLKLEAPPESFAIKEGFLNIGQQKLSYGQMALLAKTYQVIFNVSVALVDPAAYKNAQPLIKEILEFFKLSMAKQDKLFKKQMQKAINADQFLNDTIKGLSEVKTVGDVDKAQELIAEALKDGKITDKEYKRIKKVIDLQGSMASSNEAVHQGRKLLTRISLLVRYLIQPRQEGTPKLVNSMVMLITGGKDVRKRLLDFSDGSFAKKMAKYGLPIGGAMLASSMLPESHSLHIYKSLDLISAIAQHFKGYLIHIDYGRNYLDLSKDALITSTTGWTYFLDTYFANGVWGKFLYGLSQVLLVPLKLFASIHFLVNSVKLLFKTWRTRQLSPKEERSFVRSFVKAANQDQKEYWNSLSEAEKKSSGSDAKNISKEEVRLLQEHIERLKNGRESTKTLEKSIKRASLGKSPFAKSYWSSVKGIFAKIKFGKETSEKTEKVANELNVKNSDSVLKALSNTFLSYSSLRSTFKFNATFWNYLFISVRSNAFSPRKWLMALIYPNYFSVAATQPSGKQHFPSRYNRGLESMPEKIRSLVSRAGAHSALSKVPKIRDLFLSKEALANLGKFENSVSKVETVAIEIAFKKAQIALMEQIKDPKRLQTIFDSAQRGGEVSTGIRSLHDKKLKKLTTKERVFFRAYFTRTFDIMMQNFLIQLTDTKLGSEMNPETFAKRFVQEVRAENITDFNFSEKEALKIEAKVEAEIDFSKIRAWADKVANEISSVKKRINIQFRHKLLESVHPENFQIQRFLTAGKKVNEPRAMERAMRMEVSSLLTSIPIGILSTLALYAGVKTGAIQPFDPMGLDTKTHFNYMSRYLFYSGFIPGIIIGMMANTWYKVQEDSRIDALGGFDKAVSHADKQKGFWRFYLKNAFKNPENKWKSNQIFMLKLITANIPAAAVTYAVSHIYGLGRIDMGAMISGYVIVYSTVMIGFGVKMSQAFELASSWVYEKIPRKLRAHPDAQKYIGNTLQKLKISFGYMESLWNILVVENITGTMLTLKDNVKYGTRPFIRLLGGGETITIFISNLADKMLEAFKGVPGVETPIELFKKLFTNNYEAFERYPERLTKGYEHIEKLKEIPGLPKNWLAEIIGKTTAAVTTVGTFTAAPYLAVEALQRRKEKKLQKQGMDLRSCKRIFAR